MSQKQNEAMNQAIDLLINNDTDISTLLKEDGLLKQLTKRLVEKALQSEMNNHLGYDKYCHTDSDVIAKIKGTSKLHEKGTREVGVT
ncbi:transposase [Rickettsia endosymbiont of Gonocerus acuteangulatus]|uniref:transposase n=1 Tax=Rickettsia endosymbiont of Gonocerus acuteangulatus TaxID=3066266 RepID=UPI00397B611E